MLCDDCQKRPATIFFKEILPKKTVELHLCEECAQKRGLATTKKMSPIELLQKLLKEKTAQDAQVICSGCYLSLAEFKRTGRFGCSKCVDSFGSYIKNLIKKVQQSDKHIGRTTRPGEKKGMEIFKLRGQLKKALESEAYEEAAKIRDKLKDFGVENVE
ncbi:MAG: UvrB/UvrC motif-containing protein [candidate division WOR-3 bacterium]|nr:MAG: UvrB/UvrC motif-containing protein [candidate division WOR-3 bacterium]